MKLVTLIPAVFALGAGVALAQPGPPEPRTGSAAEAHPDFALADTDKDGLLSIAELQAALPDVKITDKNADGFVNQSEAEAAINGLAFETNGYTGGSSLVSEAEYELLVSSIDEVEAPAGVRKGARSND